MIYCLRLDFDIEKKRYTKLFHQISAERLFKVRQYCEVEERIQRTLSELLARYSIANYARIEMDKIIFEFGRYGKPFIKNMDNIYFNVSHSGNWIVCVVDEVPVGIDIEKISAIDMGTAGYFFNYQERQFVKKANSLEEQYIRLTQIWTIKESFLKLNGDGLYGDLMAISLNIDDLIYKRKIIRENGNGLQFLQFFMNNKYVMSVNDTGTNEIMELSTNIFY